MARYTVPYGSKAAPYSCLRMWSRRGRAGGAMGCGGHPSGAATDWPTTTTTNYKPPHKSTKDHVTLTVTKEYLIIYIRGGGGVGVWWEHFWQNENHTEFLSLCTDNSQPLSIDAHNGKILYVYIIFERWMCIKVHNRNYIVCAHACCMACFNHSLYF